MKPLKLKPYMAVYVKWIDSTTVSGWLKADTDISALSIETLGYVRKVQKDGLVLASSITLLVETRDSLGVAIIPWGTILEIRPLGKKWDRAK